jgi:phospholipid-binding lipoprotein MlaA
VAPVLFFLLVLVAIASGCGSISAALDPDSAASAPRPPGLAEVRPEPSPAPSANVGESVPPPAWTQVESPFSAQYTTDAARELVAAESRPEVPASLPGGETGAVDGALAPGETGAEGKARAEGDAEGMAQVRDQSIDEVDPEDYDPWEPFNERMFALNYNIDRYALKPAANVYRRIMPEPWQAMIANGYDNIRYPARLVNHVLQGRFWGAFIETSRFLINSTLGFGGLFNPATEYFGIPKSRADFGQTLARWGVGPGPYFVPPFLPPSTVRDFIGRLADSALNPIAWFLIDFWPEGFALGAGEMLNERALNYEVFQGVEETTLDLYTAVRDGYLRRRELQLKQDVD